MNNVIHTPRKVHSGLSLACCLNASVRRAAKRPLAAAVVLLLFRGAAYSAATPPVVTNGTLVFTGEQSAGIKATPPADVHEVVVRDLSAPIAPGSTIVGIDFHGTGGNNVFLTSGTLQSNVVIRTAGAGASGIAVGSTGTPPPLSNDPFLGIPIPGSSANSGGIVKVDSYSTIKTDGVGAHGIVAQSQSAGYGSDVIDALDRFSETNFSFTVTSVTNANGSAGTVGQPVQGFLVGTNGAPVAGAGGTFTINQDGTFSFNPGTNFNDLAVGQTRVSSVNFVVAGVRNGVERDSAGQLFVTITNTGSGIQVLGAGSYYGAYGESSKPQTGNVVFPDLQQYVAGLKLKATEAGGAGNSVVVTNHGAITTSGAGSHGIYASSAGTAGASGRNGGGFWSFGTRPPSVGGDGNDGGVVSVTANGAITNTYRGTVNDAGVGVFAYSAGGDGGRGGNGGTYYDGRRGGTGGAGGRVEVFGDATIHTLGDYSSGILALSQGGNGGAGGDGGVFTDGEHGGYGGKGGDVLLNGAWNITTEGNAAHGIWAKSTGGTAGTGGSGGWFSGEPAGGGSASDGGNVSVISGGRIETMGDQSFGIYAESAGGFGGQGGSGGSIFYSAGGDGSSAGSGAAVSVFQTQSGSITTHGTGSHGLYAQSIGGGGGSGGGGGAIVAEGGSGAPGGNGGSVDVLNAGQILTLGTNAHGIYAQSIGGGGGDGGSAKGAGAIGGRGSGTSNGGAVTVTNTGRITTTLERANGIFAESIGGGGGDGGASTGWFSVGGAGGGGGNGSNVTVVTSGELTTHGSDSSAIFAQSVGGGGGNGGGAISGGVFGSLAIGGTGSTGGAAGELVKVENEAAISTYGDRSHGIFAQSIGGGGGNGGYAVSVSVGSAVSLSVALGGNGAGGGDGKSVKVENHGNIFTEGKDSHGIFAQSVGGGGGSGGFSVAFAASDMGFSGSLSLGGKGAGGGNGGAVRVGNNTEANQQGFVSGDITTLGDHSYGILAQSVGGGGGDGGFSVAGAIGSLGAAVAIGGNGAGGGTGGVVNVYSKSKIVTEGKDAHGIVAQSIGGGGGSGGFSVAGTLSGLAAAASLGGTGGTGNSGGSVTLDSRGDISTGIIGRSTAGLNALSGIDTNILNLLGANGFTTISNLSTATTVQLTGIAGINQATAESILFKARGFMEKGDHAYGVLAQSVGGSGGDGGFSVGAAIGMGAAAFSMGGDGGNGGVGGAVSAHVEGDITTHGNDAHGIVVQSVGGGGGSGGFSVAGALTAGQPSGGAAVSLGGEGGVGNTGGHVTLDSGGSVNTYGNHSYGILAQSVGGGGGDGGFSVGAAAGQGAAAFSMGGDAGAGGVAGDVDVDSTTSVTTRGRDAHGIVVQSVGGGGGSGGFSVAGTLSTQVGAAASVGGSGGFGNSAGHVTLSSTGDIETSGNHAYGILAQSLGGGGGDGGFSVGAAISKYAAAFSLGGDGGTGGAGGQVDVFNASETITSGRDSHGVVVQSIGGGGGSGGFSVAGALTSGGGAAASLGGKGGLGNYGNQVTLTNLGNVFTYGDRAYGLLVQSVGGGGGDGGFSVAGTFSKNGPAAAFSMGGNGGVGGSASNVTLVAQGTISTAGSNSHAIVAQSIGGGGGSGGFSVAGSMSLGSNSPSVAVSIGGYGGTGGNAGHVGVITTGDLITSSGERAYGILAQSVGGGGGDGGFSVAGSISRSDNVSFSLGGSGGPGGSGGAVDLVNSSRIFTQGSNSYGIFAQSLGGGGGSGGFSVAGTLSTGNTNSLQVAVSIGGAGGVGSQSTNVTVRNSGDILTLGEEAHGIFAQSVGGGGGAGGFSAAGVLGAGGNHNNVNIAVSVGGGGGSGGYAGDVSVVNTGTIVTSNGVSHGIFAQSVGGGGGVGGASYTAIVALDGTTNSKTANVALSFGGKGGNGNNGGVVTVTNSGLIATSGDGSHGIFAQSIGGGGGAGGDARTISLVLGKPAIPLMGTSGQNKSLSLVVGGDGGGASDGNTVTVQNSGDITTRGADSYGIFAQSVGGGGGAGGGATHGFGGLGSPIPPELVLLPVSKVKPWNDLSIIIGGNGGSSGDAGSVDIANSGNIVTLGDASYGILAQSVGGGGGIGIASGGDANGGFLGKIALGGAAGSGGNGSNVWVTHTGDIDTSGAAAHAILAQSIGGGGGIAGDVVRTKIPFTSISVGIGLAIGQGGGNTGNGGEVVVNTSGDIVTRGSGADGIFAQSLGGGGGLAGDLGYGIGFAGSAGGNGSGGAVKINHSGDIITLGDESNGIFAQSAGSNSSGKVEIVLTGNISAQGSNSAGIFAQSVASTGVSGNIAVTLRDGTVEGGTGSGAGVLLWGGHDNSLTNFGTITTASGLSGMAILATNANTSIHNSGSIIGSVDLGQGASRFDNSSAGTVYAGSKLCLGSGQMVNAGTLSPGGARNSQATSLTGDFLQTGSGRLVIDVEPNASCDTLTVNGAAALGGELSLIKKRGFYWPRLTYDVLVATNGLSGAFSVLDLPSRPLLGFEVDQLSDRIQVQAVPQSFASVAKNRVELAVGHYLDRIAPSVSGDLWDVMGEFQDLESSQLSTAFSSLSPDSYDDYTRATYSLVQQYSKGVLQRLDTVRLNTVATGSPASAASLDPVSRVLLAYAGPSEDIGGLVAKEQQREADRANSVWAIGFGQWGKQGGKDGYTGFSFSPAGTAIGYDRALSDRLTLGVSAAYASTHVSLDDNRGGGDITSYSGAAYGSYFQNNFHVEGVLSFGLNDYDNRRNLQIGSISRTAQSTHSGQAFGTFLSGGYLWRLKPFVLEPFASLQYACLGEGAIQESGAGDASLTVQHRQTQALVSELGLRLACAFEKKNFTVIPELSVAWNHDYAIDDRVMQASYAGSLNATFTLPGQDVGPDGVTTSAALTFLFGKGISTSVRYNGEFRENYSSHGVVGQIGFSF